MARLLSVGIKAFFYVKNYYKGRIMEVFLNVVFLVLGFVMLWKGSDWFVDGASSVATKFGIPQIIIGLTVVAMGTSTPEACVSIIGSIQGNADIAVGNVVGSNVLNVLIILGLSALVLPLTLKKATAYIEIPFVIAVTLIMVLLGLDGKIGRIDGVIFLLLFIVYFVYLFISAKKSNQEVLEQSEEQSQGQPKPLWLSLVLTIVGLAIVVAGSQFTVDTATFLAKKVGLSERIIGLTIVALGTSLPELFTSVTASRKNNPDIAIGNIIGSNIFNILFVLGLAATICPMNYATDFIIDGIFAIGAVVLLLLLILPKKKLARWAGAVMLLGYVAYFIVLLLK